jgi:exonuclease III
MIGATWNIRGLNKRDKLQCITDFIADNNLDFVTFQETKKESFEDSFLKYAKHNFIWNFLPANGTAGGILVGFDSNKFEIIAWQVKQFCISAMVRNTDSKLVWRFISVYGSAYEEGKDEFIQELHSLLENWDGPTLIGGTLI